MRGSFVLGVVGGIFSFMAGILAFLLGAIGNASNAWERALGYAASTDVRLMWICGALAFLAGILGIIGGAMGKKGGAALLFAGGILALIATSLFGALPCILMVVGGALAFREKTTEGVAKPSPLSVGNVQYCPNCGAKANPGAQFCGQCGQRLRP